MARFLLAIVAFVLAIAVLKMVIAALIIAGLIFRTKETIGLILLFGLLAVIRAAPLLGLGLLALVIVMAVVLKKREARALRQAGRALLSDDPDQE
ncbi:MAG: hypothetical protein EON59_00985 [Alphaproteobacteria bacterium]|nr:MAG: hypothetical protein EON59_00985 [Alphaproteobacteria bacterium]